MPVPALPLEILDRIIDLLEKHEDREEERDDHDKDEDEDEALPAKYSKTLLACHTVSKQFRVCALRHICRSVFISLRDTPKRLRRLQDLIVEEVNPELGSFAPFVKEVDILTVPPQNMPSQEPPTCEQVEIQEEALLQVLKLFDERITIQRLSILAIGSGLDWKSLSLAIEKALQSLLQLPSVFSLRFRGIKSLPVRLLVSNARLKSLDVGFCWEWQELSLITSLPDLEHLTIRDLSQFPEGLTFPSLQTANAHNADKHDSHTSWTVISRTSKTLKHLTVYDDECE